MPAKAAWIAKKRREARTLGLCITCCKQRPSPGHSVCRSCTESASQRTIQRRISSRRRAQSQQLIVAHEEAGDGASEHHLYEDASSHYQIALTVSTITAEARLRISEKLSNVLVFGKNPGTTNLSIEQFALQRLENATESVNALRVIYQRLRQLEISLKIEEALSLITPVIRIGETLVDPYIVKMAQVRRAGFLLELGRRDEAERNLDSIGDISVEENLVLRATYYLTRARGASSLGNAKEAYENFDRAIEAAERYPDYYRMTSIWDNYGLCALELGSIDLAKTCTERALLIARQHRISWRIPELCLTYAGILIKMGRYEVAHDYLIDALSYDVQAPVIDQMFAEVGIPLALHVSDEATLTKCVRPAIIPIVFQSRISDAIGPTVAAFARLYAAQGKLQKARKLLHRALETVHHVGNSCDFVLEVAICGSTADVPRARSLLLKRLTVPHHDVARAYLSLFDAFVERRNKRLDNVSRYATEAIQRFEALRWYGYVNLARTLLPFGAQVAPMAEAMFKPFVDMHTVLTMREQQVAELVLKGLTNREIALQLSITKHTVDSHVASLMSRLGIRSRHQLPEVVGSKDH